MRDERPGPHGADRGAADGCYGVTMPPLTFSVSPET